MKNNNNNNLEEIKASLETFQNKVKNCKEIDNKDKGRTLILLLNKVEKEIDKLTEELNILWTNAYKKNDESVKHLINNNLETLKEVKLKIQKARLTLSFRFI